MSARTVLLAVGFVSCARALAATPFQLDLPLRDPLQGTSPPVLESGATLPGEIAPVPCPAGEAFALPLGLGEAVDLALCNNPQIKAAWANIKVQAGALGEARAAYLPTLSATINRLNTHNSYPDSALPGNTNLGTTASATLNWRLFDFGGRQANREAANRLLIAAIASHDAALQKTLTGVIQAYFDAQTAQATAQAKERNETIARSTLDSTTRRASRGVAARSDTLQATTALAKVTLERNRARGTYQKALAVLATSLGISPGTRIVLADDVKDGESNGDNRSLQDWMDIAEQSHPAIRAARAEWEASLQKVEVTRSEGMPTLDFSLNHYKNGFPNQGVSSSQSRQTTFGVSVSIPLFDGFSRTYKIKGAQAQAEQREAQLQDTQQNVLMELVKAHADASFALDNLQASEQLLMAAQESLDTLRRKYEGGAADILEILSAQMALSDAQEERIRSLSEWRSSRLRLLASAGVMNRSAAGR
ncbi:MAG TPA: TolC family protein [Ramlibacter sp.]|uniref:TolC family protein n=1 Tax=Ramlibacter sp. TaxID=1917967 RepID=UPI002C124B4B|nr:TolC family protein [Ramlibacter sp.]HVZ45072.1 TolC family protein [Ramlibacter sp.]